MKRTGKTVKKGKHFCSAMLDYKVVNGGHFFMFEKNGSRMTEFAEIIEHRILN